MKDGRFHQRDRKILSPNKEPILCMVFYENTMHGKKTRLKVEFFSTVTIIIVNTIGL